MLITAHMVALNATSHFIAQCAGGMALGTGSFSSPDRRLLSPVEGSAHSTGLLGLGNPLVSPFQQQRGVSPQLGQAAGYPPHSPLDPAAPPRADAAAPLQPPPPPRPSPPPPPPPTSRQSMSLDLPRPGAQHGSQSFFSASLGAGGHLDSPERQFGRLRLSADETYQVRLNHGTEHLVSLLS